MIEELAKSFDNGEAEAEPAITVSLSGGKLDELAEDILSLILRNTGTSVPYFYAQYFTAPATSNDDPTAPGIAHGVGYEIEQYPLEQQRVASHPSIISHNL